MKPAQATNRQASRARRHAVQKTREELYWAVKRFLAAEPCQLPALRRELEVAANKAERAYVAYRRPVVARMLRRRA